MLASISGSQGTGKSTLLAALADRYPTIQRKTSRSILSDWGVSLSQVNNDHPLTIKFQEEILKRKLEDEAEALIASEMFLTERTTIDLMVYNNFAIGSENQFNDFVNDYSQRCIDTIDRYDFVFYIERGKFTPVDDGVRGINVHYQHMVDVVMKDAYVRYIPRNKLHVIADTNVDARVRAVVDILSKRSSQLKV